jgi:hypothetical protein
MILIQESPASGQILNLVKPVGKEIPFRMGEIIEGQVTDIFPSGGMTIKVKGGFLPVRTDLNFKKNETLFLKVLGQERKNGEVVLQLINTRIRSGGGDLWIGKGTGNSEDPARKASDLIMKFIGPGVDSRKVLTGQSWEIGKLRVVLGELVKSLPLNMQSIPRGLKIQLQHVLQASLPGLVPDIQGKILQLIRELNGEVQYSFLKENLAGILIPMEDLDSGILKKALDNSGVLLEAKLRAMSKAGLAGEASSPFEKSKLDNDLKSIVLQLKEVIQNTKEPGSAVGFFQRIRERGARNGETELPLFHKALGTIDTLMKEVETFQLISKISDSFHTFLPILWNDMKRGELVLKKKQQPKGVSYSCAIHLELERLGPISVLLFMQSRNFYVNFKTDHPALNRVISSHLEELQESFNREELNLKSVSFFEKGDPHSDIWESMESEENLINIRV